MDHICTSFAVKVTVIIAISHLCSSFPHDQKHQSLGGDTFTKWQLSLMNPVILVVISVFVLVCFTLVILQCLDICRRGETGFKDFENEDPISEVVPPAASEFTMYPPVENTPETMSAAPVYFEPLPDFSHRLEDKNQHLLNQTQLRPKISEDSHNRADSLDSLEDIMEQDSLHDKVKLQNLLTNARNHIPRSQLQYIKELGNGWFGKVLQGEGHKILPGHKKTKVVIQMLREEANQQEQLTFLQEATPFRDAEHPNVMRLLGQCVETMPYLTILDLCPFGDVKTYLKSHKIAMDSFNEKGILLKFACDMAAGLQALHQQNYIHRDFAIRNCMLGSDLTVKVGDYGLGEEIYKEDYYTDENGDAIPIRWLAPECVLINDIDASITLKHISKESNIWSYGVAMWEVFQFGLQPYGDLSDIHVLRLVLKENSLKLQKPDNPLLHLPRIYQLMQLCWADPGNRPSLRELRIMLLHLLSRKDESDTSAFDQKWKQLMPRRQPIVTHVNDVESSLNQQVNNDNVQTLAATTAPGDAPVSVHSKRPTDFSSSMVSLDVSALSDGLSNGGPEADVCSPDMDDDDMAAIHHLYGRANSQTTPLNEMPLDFEITAANAATVGAKLQQPVSDDINNQKLTSPMADTQYEKQNPNEKNSEVLVPDSLSSEQKNTNNITKPISFHDGNILQNNDNFSNCDNTVSKEVKSNIGDSFVFLPEDSDFPNKFVTSTPKGKTVEAGSDSELFFSAMDSSSKSQSDISQSDSADKLQLSKQPSILSSTSSNYHTALNTYSQTSIDLSVPYEERSIMAQDKFAAMLQTVATSFDVDDSGESSLERSLEEEVFNVSRGTLLEQKIPEEQEFEIVVTPSDDSNTTNSTITETHPFDETDGPIEVSTPRDEKEDTSSLKDDLDIQPEQGEEETNESYVNVENIVADNMDSTSP